MEPGLLRTKVALERAAETVDTSGSVVQTWSTLANRFADVRPVSGREYLTAGQEVGEVSHKIRLRIDASIADLSPKDRVNVAGRLFDILSVRNIQERGREFELMCREIA